MNTILVTATEESSGKTAVALALAQLARERDFDVGYMKPKGTHFRGASSETIDDDARFALDLLDIDADVDDCCPVGYSRTFAEQTVRGEQDLEKLQQLVHMCCQELANDRDFMFVEGGGRFTTGGIIHLTDPDVAELLDSRVLLIAHYESVWDLDDVLAAAERFGDRLTGVLFNTVADTNLNRVVEEVAPFLQSRDIPVLGVIPKTTALAGVTVADLARETNAEILTNSSTDAFIERFLVGAMSSDAALKHFRRTNNAALITGGNRSDLQTIALEAPGIQCLILTDGLRPSDAVLGKAEDHNVPILLLSMDTLTAIEQVEDVIRSGRTRDKQSVSRMQELLEEYADIDTLLSGTNGASADEYSKNDTQ
jgi:uncharacterized protein